MHGRTALRRLFCLVRLQLGKHRNPALWGTCQQRGALFSVYNLRPKPVVSSSLSVPLFPFPEEEEETKEWVESFQGGVTRCPRVPLWPLGGTYHLSLVPYKNPGGEQTWWGGGGALFFLRGAGWLGSRAMIPQGLCTCSFVALLSLCSPQKPFLISLAGGKTLLLSILIVHFMPLHTSDHLQFCGLFG